MKVLRTYFTLPKVILISILLVGVILRFHNTPQRYGFDYDATRDALIAVYGANVFQLPMHGPASALGNFNFGPWYYYQLIGFQFFVPYQYAPWVSVSLLSILGIFFMYKLGETIGDWRLGGILALLTAISPAQIIAGTGLSNPDMVFVCCAFVLWVFAKAIKEKISLWWAFFFGLVLGIGINYHFQTLTFLLFLPLLFVAQKHQRFKFIYVSLIGLITSFIPLIFFNAINHWHTVRGFFFYLTDGKNSVYIPNSWTIYLRDFWPEFWAYVIGVPVIPGLIIGVLTAGIIVWSIVTKKIEKSMLLLIVAFIIQFLYLRYHTGSRESYYLLYLHPFIFLFVGYAFWRVLQLKKGLVLGLLALITLVGVVIPKSFAVGHTMESHVNYKADIEFLKSSYPDQEFSILDCGRQDRNRSQAYAFLLHSEHLLSDNGVPIGVYDDSCYTVDGDDRVYSDKNIIDLGGYSKDEITDAGWTPISPETVYKRELKWWYEEKP